MMRLNKLKTLTMKAFEALGGGGALRQLSSREAKQLGYLRKEVSKLVSKEELCHVGALAETSKGLSNSKVLRFFGLCPQNDKPYNVKNLLTYSPINLFTKRRVAFTLAEVLITLGVIGVVASLTMPTLIQNHKEKVLITQNKVAYSTVKQALERVRADNEFWLDSVFNPNNTSLESLQAFARYFKGAKVLKNQTAYTVKLMKKLEATNGKYSKSSMSGNRIALANGMFVTVTQYNCQPTEYTSVKNGANGEIIRDENGDPVMYNYTEQKCAVVTVDVNGLKAPNQIGRDIFKVWVNAQDYNFLKSNWGGDVENVITQEKFSDKIQDYDPNANFGE